MLACVALAGGALASCTGGGSAGDAVAGDAVASDAGLSGEGAGTPLSPADSVAGDAPQSFKFESGELVIGDFDPNTLGDNLFDPCTEISPEEFAAAGFENVEPLPDELRGLNKGLNACFFDKHPELMVESLNNNNANRELLEKNGLILEGYSSQVLPSLFVHRPKSQSGSDCYAQVDTLRGGLISAAGGGPGSNDQELSCQIAIQNLESLLLTLK